jgi:hypothetical protein
LAEDLEEQLDISDKNAHRITLLPADAGNNLEV